eukprot:1470745-Rhodomonas_salina.1
MPVISSRAQPQPHWQSEHRPSARVDSPFATLPCLRCVQGVWCPQFPRDWHMRVAALNADTLSN